MWSNGFTFPAANLFWSSNTVAGTATSGWAVRLDAGNSGGSVKTLTNVVLFVSGTGIGSVSLAKTGQNTSYNANDDGVLRQGKAWPEPRFINNGNGTITDKLTGLMWERKKLPVPFVYLPLT